MTETSKEYTLKFKSIILLLVLVVSISRIDSRNGIFLFTGDGQGTDSPGFELFDSDNGHDLTLSPQTFTANTTADSFLVNDNSNSIGMPVNESDTGNSKIKQTLYHIKTIKL